MSDADVRLKCLELAMTQARNETQHGNIDRVVEISTRFYNHVNSVGDVPTSAVKIDKKAKPDKAPEIFR
jgi:hypothetical protein